MRLLLCGVRGSTPAPGPEFVRYGGHTSSVAVLRDDGPPRLVLDAGTGLQRLTKHLNGTPFRGTILLGHLHWDHTHGLPFFRAGAHRDARVTVVVPAQGDPEELFDRCISPPHFPVRLGELGGEWRFENIEPGMHKIEGYSVEAREIPHKGGRTFGYRISDGEVTVVYMSDHGPFALGEGPEGLGVYHEDACSLVRGADLVLHDAQHTAEEFGAYAHFGHSAVDYAVRLAETAGVRRLLLFHHDPYRTDDELDRIGEEFSGRACEVEVAREGSEIEVLPALADEDAEIG